MTGTSGVPVCNATRTNPFRFFSTHLQALYLVWNASRAPPTTKTTAFDVKPSEFAASNGSFDWFKRAFSEFLDAEQKPQFKSSSRCTGKWNVKPSVVHFARMPGNNVDHFEWFEPKFTPIPRLWKKLWKNYFFLKFWDFWIKKIITSIAHVERHKANSCGLVANQRFSPN